MRHCKMLNGLLSPSGTDAKVLVVCQADGLTDSSASFSDTKGVKEQKHYFQNQPPEWKPRI